MQSDGDLNCKILHVQAITFHSEFNSYGDLKLPDILQKMRSMVSTKKEFYSELYTLLNLLLVMPASNAVSERSFSSMKLT